HGGAVDGAERLESLPQCLRHSPPSVRYQVAVRVSPVAKSVRATQPVSRVSAAALQVHAGARNSFALSAESKVARPARWARDLIAHSAPRASQAGSGMIVGDLPSDRPTASTSSRLVITAGCAA